MSLTILLLVLCTGAAAWLGWRHFRGRLANEPAGEAPSARRRSGAGLVYAPPETGPRHFQPARPREEGEPTGLEAFDIPRPMGDPDPRD